MTFVFGKLSQSRMVGLHPDLVRVLNRALTLSTVDFMVVEGVRSDEDCRINYGKGRTEAQCVAVGLAGKYAQPKLSKVTWLKNPLGSRHRKQADGFGHAVDLLPAPYDWKGTAGFAAVENAMKAAATAENINIVAGADWKPADMPHFELAGQR